MSLFFIKNGDIIEVDEYVKCYFCGKDDLGKVVSKRSGREYLVHTHTDDSGQIYADRCYIHRCKT